MTAAAPFLLPEDEGLPDVRRLELEVGQAVARLTGRQVRRRVAPWIHERPGAPVVVFELSVPAGWIRIPCYLRDGVVAQGLLDLLLVRGVIVLAVSEQYGAARRHLGLALSSKATLPEPTIERTHLALGKEGGPWHAAGATLAEMYSRLFLVIAPALEPEVPTDG